MKVNNRLKNIICIIIFLSILLFIVTRFPIYDREEVKVYFMSLRGNPYAALIYIAITVVLTLFFVPVSWMVVISCVLFGFIKGFIYSLSAAAVSCIISFLIGRIFKEDFRVYLFKKLEKGKSNIDIKSISQRIEKEGFKYTFLLRNVPLLPFTIVNYLSGVTSIKFKDYVMGSILGMIPNMFISIYFISSTIDIRDNPRGMILPLILATVYFSIVYRLGKKYRIG